VRSQVRSQVRSRVVSQDYLPRLFSR
jgi:hypothetical protein